MNHLAERMSLARPSATKAMTARAKALKAEGRDIIVLSQGEPDFDTPEHIREAAKRAIEAGETRYTPVAGIGELREAIADKLKRDNGLEYSADAVSVGCGAKQVIFNALLATLDPGDEVLIPAPCWVSYPEMVALAGGTPRVVHTSPAAGLKLSPEELEAAISKRTKWLMLNSPCNPTGAVYSADELRALADVLERNPQVWVLADDIYEKLVYAPARFATIAQAAPQLAERTLVVNGVSKANCMTGWRVGYGAGPLPLIKAMNLIQGQTTSHTSSISQWAALAALTGPQDHVESARKSFEVRRNLMVGMLRTAAGISCTVPEGAFYLFPDCSGLVGASANGALLKDDEDVCSWLLEAAGVAVVPGSSFLADGHLRISFASSEDELARACKCISEACAEVEFPRPPQEM